jgi:hypothetical protein
MNRSDYIAYRSKFTPAIVKLVIVAESPPASGKYFYNPAGAISEPLFAALMKQLGISPTTKEQGLREFQYKGWVLVDTTYEPVNGLDREELVGPVPCCIVTISTIAHLIGFAGPAILLPRAGAGILPAGNALANKRS